jgi:hypothetical protein
MEEDMALPRRNDTLLLGGIRATRSSSMRFTEPQGRTRPTSSIDSIIRSTFVDFAVLRIWLHHLVGGEGEETFSP